MFFKNLNNRVFLYRLYPGVLYSWNSLPFRVCKPTRRICARLRMTRNSRYLEEDGKKFEVSNLIFFFKNWIVYNDLNTNSLLRYLISFLFFKSHQSKAWFFLYFCLRQCFPNVEKRHLLHLHSNINLMSQCFQNVFDGSVWNRSYSRLFLSFILATVDVVDGFW